MCPEALRRILGVSAIGCLCGLPLIPQVVSNGIMAATSSAWDFSAATSLKVPLSAGAAPILDGWLSFDSVAHNLVWGSNGSTKTGASKSGAILAGDCAKWDASGNLVDSGGACGTGGGIGSVSGTSPISSTGGTTPAISCATCVTSSAALTNLAIVAGAGAQLSQKTNITTDGGLNSFILPGSLTTGSGNNSAGYVQFGQGTNAWPGAANTVGWGAPASVSGNYELLLPGTLPAANQILLCGAPVTNLSACAWSSFASTNLTDAAFLMYNNASNTVTGGTQNFSGAAHTLPEVKGLTAAKPAACTVGEVYFATDATAGQNQFYCTAANTWTQQLGGGGSGSLTVQDHTTAQTQRPTINFRDGHIASDDSTNQATIVDWTPNDARIVTLNEEFMAGTTTSGNTGQNGWNFDLLGANGSVSLGASVWPNLGILTLHGSTAASNGVALHLGTATTPNNPFGDLVDNANWDSTWIFKFTNSTVRHRVGFANQCNAVAPANGWFLRFDTTLGDASTYKFEVRVSGSPTIVDTGVNVDTNFHTLRIRNTGGATIRFSLDGGAEKLICSGCADINVAPPTTGMDACAVSSTDASASVVELDLDKFSFSARVKSGSANTRN